MAKRMFQSEHDEMVEYVANYLRENGFRNIKADIPGFNRPDRIVWRMTNEGHIPDATAVGWDFNLFEVETEDSIDDQHTEDQWRLFATFAEEKSVKFWVVVPKGTEKLVERRLAELELIAHIWEIPRPGSK